MKVVIAGGSGLVGRHLASSLVDDGHEVIVLSRQPRRAGRRLPAAVRVEQWDPTRPSAVLALTIANTTAVVNLAGASIGRWPWTAGRKRELRDSRLNATRSLVEAIAALSPSDRPAALLNASGVDIYEGHDDEPAVEATPPVDTFLARLCVEWEAAAMAAEQLGVRVVLLRMSMVVAAGAPALARLALPVRLFAGGPIGTGRQWISWVAVDDAVGLIRRAISGWDISGPLNVAAPQPVEQRTFARVLAAVLHRPAWLRTPAWLVRLVLGEQATLALGSRRAAPARALEASYSFQRPDLPSALVAALAGPRRSTR